MNRLAGKRIFLTGAAQGIGLAIAKACLAEGASLLAVDRDGATLAGALPQSDRLALATVDITDRPGIEAAMAGSPIGPINAVINNAGINVFAPPLQTSDADWDRAFDVNVKGAWNCIRAALPGMIAAGGGAVLNIASTHSFTVIPGSFPYPVAKHALLGLTKSLALEFAPQGVRVNALAPGYVLTQKTLDWWATFPDPQAARAATMALHPGGRIATPEEIAKAAVFLISDEVPFMTAACLVVDGGLGTLQHA